MQIPVCKLTAHLTCFNFKLSIGVKREIMLEDSIAEKEARIAR